MTTPRREFFLIGREKVKLDFDILTCEYENETLSKGLTELNLNHIGLYGMVRHALPAILLKE